MKPTAPRSRQVREIRFERPDRRALGVETLRLEELLARQLAFDLAEPQRIDFHQLALVEGGRSSHSVDFAPHRIGPGALLVVRAGQTQAFAPARVARGRIVVFTPTYLQDRPDPSGQLALATRVVLWGGPVIDLGVTSRRRTVTAFQLLEALSTSPPRPFLDDALGAAFDALLLSVAGLPELAARTAAREAGDPLVARFDRVLEDHYRAERNAARYARQLHVSVRTLDRHLRAARAETTKEAITARTLLEAKRLLTRRDVQIKAVAEDLGFTEPQNFTRYFRTGVGQSPAAFRAGLTRGG